MHTGAIAARLLCTIAAVCIFALPTEAREESLGDKIKKILQPTPTPTPRKHRKKTSTKKESTSPTPSVKANPKSSPSPSVDSRRRKKSSPTPTPEESATPSARKKHKPSPTPSPTETPTPESTETPSPTPAATARKKGAPVSISPNEIAGYENYSAKVRTMVDLALDLAARGLNYKYGSADPESGGMDCSGFVYYVLTTTGVPDVPRDSSGQYAWLRKAKSFEAVISRKDDTFELSELKPGDLLFWTGTYEIERDPPITHAMIYLGREKKTNKRIMIGASDGRTYHGESRYGVSVFDFKISPPSETKEGRLSPTFVGYGHVPGL
jgi:cell wall-associated NlpC family hydrolase